ncbi:hypothetical protein [Endozoicomonas sp. GU-1]|uniref:hypothetical protein n=1 Tax=Endozoicomonas sp. GU-1 TaxID=3009078 RepID=UPI0022B4545F|nr:hypothetical protein [Endozoicomonas sp. GU-1]WBA81149.1 hypothetical protein O2T12_23105 [Endozoicomonas sp. GU-1]WBA88715.1 hypothetical protein O3276_12290 [Endozoicomonas sp. GU-1]
MADSPVGLPVATIDHCFARYKGRKPSLMFTPGTLTIRRLQINIPTQQSLLLALES